MWIGILCYAVCPTGSSKKNFEEEILKLVLNGLDVGDINHSLEFCTKPFVSEQVTERLKSFFSSRLDHLVCKPPVNLQADKETNVHKTRQFTSVVTVNPESPKLTYIYLDQPAVKSHDELNSWAIQRDQLEGGSSDEQYFHLNVSAHVTKPLNLSDQFICTRDPLHKGGVVQ